MLSFLKWMLPASAALALVLGLTAVSAKAADAAAEKLTIKGKVVDKDDKPVKEATVRITKAMQRGQGQQGQRPEPIATTTTKEDGTFTLEVEKAKLPDGNYSVGTMVQGQGFGRARIAVKEGKVDPAEELTLKLAQRQRQGGGGGGQQ